MRLYELSHATHKPEQIGELRLPQEVAAAFYDSDMEVLNNSHMRLVMELMGRQYPCFVPKRFRGLRWTSGIIGHMTCQVPWGRIAGRRSMQVRDPVYSLPQPTEADLGRGDHNTARPAGAYPVPELGDEWRRTFYRLEREILGPDLTVDMPKRFLRGPLGILPDWPPGEDDQFYLPIQVLRSNGPWLPAEWTIIGVWRMCRFMLEKHEQQRVHYYSQGELVARFPNLIPKEYNIHGRRTTAMDQEAVCVRFAYESNNGWGTHLPNYNRPVGPNANMMDVQPYLYIQSEWNEMLYEPYTFMTTLHIHGHGEEAEPQRTRRRPAQGSGRRTTR